MKEECRGCKVLALCVVRGEKMFLSHVVYKCIECKKTFLWVDDGSSFWTGMETVGEISINCCKDVKPNAAGSPINWRRCKLCRHGFKVSSSSV